MMRQTQTSVHSVYLQFMQNFHRNRWYDPNSRRESYAAGYCMFGVFSREMKMSYILIFVAFNACIYIERDRSLSILRKIQVYYFSETKHSRNVELFIKRFSFLLK